jgi:hypothetical protein
MSDVIDITGIDKAAILAALFNSSAPVGMGLLQADKGPQTMTVEQAREIIDGGGQAATPDYEFKQLTGRPALSFDYVFGRPLKCNLEGDEFDPWGFDRDNGGEGTAMRVIDQLR